MTIIKHIGLMLPTDSSDQTLQQMTTWKRVLVDIKTN